MITQGQQRAAELEVANADKPWVLLRPLGFQPGLTRAEGRMLFNVVGGDIPPGSTVTAETMLKDGYRVEVVE